MADEGMELGKSEGAGAIDILRGMREIQRAIWKFNAGEHDKTKHVTMHAPDTVHLNDLGQLAMAFAILKGLGAPDLVSSMTVDANNGKVVAAEGCQISNETVGCRLGATVSGLAPGRRPKLLCGGVLVVLRAMCAFRTCASLGCAR